MGEKGEKTRCRIIRSARTLFGSTGFTKTSMDDIVRVAGVTKGNLYYYFSSKEELGSAVLDETIAEQFGTEQIDGERDPVREILAMFRRAEKKMAGGQCKGGCLLGNLALEVSDMHDQLRRKLDHAFSTWEARVEGVLESGQRRGLLRATLQPKAAARFIVATLEGGILLSKVKRDVRALKNCAEMVELVLEGFRA
ncbi:MAG: TetR family transcriptional regulator C-terminal domain-containing protein [Nitrospirae bacterium]|nr:TetR family transcriptional regulator C-terminal domain-containing protein [Nitrospirota bacterium]